MITTPTNIVNAHKTDAEAIAEFQAYMLKYTREIIERMEKRLPTLRGALHRDMTDNIRVLTEYCDQIEREGVVSVMNELQQYIHDYVVAGELALDRVQEWFVTV